MVFQETKLFEGSIIDNISRNSNKKDIFQHFEGFEINKIFKNFPNQIDTLIIENGNNISGGQKQLIGILRAIYIKPKILILDEPTNNLDIPTKKIFFELLSKIKNNMIILIISHDNQLTEIADRIFTLQNKKILEKQ